VRHGSTQAQEGRSDILSALLAPYADADPGQRGRLVDVPPTVAAEALQLLLVEQVDSRCNGTQPPMRWLVKQAAALRGRLVGSVAAGRRYARFDGIQVPTPAARLLAERIAADWPGTDIAPAALPAAVAEAWTSWDANEPIWTGTGPNLLTSGLPSKVVVVGLWWD
jgi:hypothetical protein